MNVQRPTKTALLRREDKEMLESKFEHTNKWSLSLPCPQCGAVIHVRNSTVIPWPGLCRGCYESIYIYPDGHYELHGLDTGAMCDYESESGGDY